MSLPQLLTVWGMIKHSFYKGICALFSCCISYLNDDSGILEEEIKGEKKKLSKQQSNSGGWQTLEHKENCEQLFLDREDWVKETIYNSCL